MSWIIDNWDNIITILNAIGLVLVTKKRSS